jgi:hypothetical protein
MALDYLPIQASAVPSERVFSSSAQTDTARRNSIKPILMESLQMLKFGKLSFVCFFICANHYLGLKKTRLDFTNGWVTHESLMVDPQEPTDDVLGKFIVDDSDVMFDELMDLLGDDDDVVAPVLS